MNENKSCASCGGPYIETLGESDVTIHNQADCISFLKKKVQHSRAETIRELDAKYNSYCEKKVAGAIEHMENKLKEAEQINLLNANSIMRGRARNQKLEAVVIAAAYCHRHGHIAEVAVKFTGLDKYLKALDGDQ